MLLHLYKKGQWLTPPVIMKKPWWLVIWTLEPWNMFVHCIHNLRGGKPHSKSRENLSTGDVDPPHHFRGAPETLESCSVPSPCLRLHLCLEGICFARRSPSPWSLLSAASGTKNLLFASSSVHLGWHGGQRLVPAFLPPCSAEALLELTPEAARCFLHNIYICGLSTGFWPDTCK